jgi:hypothetical protein
MRNYVVIGAIVWALSAIPSMAQDPATGAAVGAGAGAAAGGVVGGPAGGPIVQTVRSELLYKFNWSQ